MNSRREDSHKKRMNICSRERTKGVGDMFAL